MFTSVSTDVAAMDVDVAVAVFVTLTVKVVLAPTVAVKVGVVAIHEQADDTMSSAIVCSANEQLAIHITCRLKLSVTCKL